MLLNVFLAIAGLATTADAVTRKYLISAHKMHANEVAEFCRKAGLREDLKAWPAHIDEENIKEAREKMVERRVSEVYVGSVMKRGKTIYIKNPVVYITKKSRKVRQRTRTGRSVTGTEISYRAHLKNTGGSTKRYALCQAHENNEEVSESGTESVTESSSNASISQTETSSADFEYKRRNHTRRSKSSKKNRRKSTKSRRKSSQKRSKSYKGSKSSQKYDF